MDTTTIGIFAVLLVGIALLGWSVAGVLAPPALQNTPANAARAFAAELPDKCATPPGYTDADWRTHLGHHPEQYAECL